MAFLFVESLPHNNSRVVQTAIKALELLLLSAGLISTLLMVKGAVMMPYSCGIVFSCLVGFWDSIRCFLSSPLYICIIINSMVVLIAASSTFHRHETDNHDYYDIKSNVVDFHDNILIAESPVVSPPPPQPSLPRDVIKITPQSPHRNVAEVEAAPLGTLLSRIKKCSKVIAASTLYQGSDHDDSTHILPDSAAQNCIEKNYLSSPAASFSDGALIKEKGLFLEMEAEVANNQPDDTENEEDDTMEATWKAITGGGKPSPKRKQLKKSETWVVHVPPPSTAAKQRPDSEELLASTPTWKELRKSETFNEAVSVTRRGGLRRDPSISLDEFNQQVEAFIKKFNDNMRLQRQESDQRFLDMIKRGL
ncbi:hypothetical protein Pfo_020868 [Paulownia fortunei]|nr:hypothetical protein Pfo_020868 [Paulownia fortunei]